MKRIFVLLIVLLLLGCSNNEVKEESIEEIEPVEEVKEVYKDDNPIVVGLYGDNNKLVTDYYTYKTGYKDLVFTAYYTNDESLIGGTLKSVWYNYYNKYSNIDKARIGYNITFNVEDKTISKNITFVDNEYIFDPYFYVYLYDDIHQNSSWYSHITKEQDTDSTMYTSIKLYLVEIEKVTSPITLTVFTYDSDDDFDESGNYRGNSKYQIQINWK